MHPNMLKALKRPDPAGGAHDATMQTSGRTRGEARRGLAHLKDLMSPVKHLFEKVQGLEDPYP